MYLTYEILFQPVLFFFCLIVCVFGLSMDTETENKHATALEAMRDIQKYYEDAEF